MMTARPWAQRRKQCQSVVELCCQFTVNELDQDELDIYDVVRIGVLVRDKLGINCIVDNRILANCGCFLVILKQFYL